MIMELTMTKRPLLCVALPLALFALPALSCEYPTRIEVPDGRTATQDNMLEGQQAVKGYMSAMEAYLDCIDKESESLASDGDEDAEKEQRAILVSKHNAAVDDMEGVADSFNEQVRAYKAANE